MIAAPCRDQNIELSRKNEVRQVSHGCSHRHNWYLRSTQPLVRISNKEVWLQLGRPERQRAQTVRAVYHDDHPAAYDKRTVSSTANGNRSSSSRAHRQSSDKDSRLLSSPLAALANERGDRQQQRRVAGDVVKYRNLGGRCAVQCLNDQVHNLMYGRHKHTQRMSIAKH